MRRIWIGVCVLAGLAASANATTLLPLDARELAQRAERIFEGDVVSVARAIDENHLPVMFVTIRVTDGIKNAHTGETITFKQIDEFIPGLPHYQAGEHVLLFLAGVSRLGLTAPLGLGQGHFRVGEDDLGREMLVNDFSNLHLFEKSQALARSEALSSEERHMLIERHGPVERDTFVRFIRREAAREVPREQ